MTLPAVLETPRLHLRRPSAGDADQVFSRFASDAAATRYLAWPRHQTLHDTRAYLERCDSEWETTGAGPYLVFTREGLLIGSTGIHLDTDAPYRACTGYVLAPDAWGRGYATEVACAMAELALSVPQIARVYSFCHREHLASAHVLEKAGFVREGVLRRYLVFPNLGEQEPSDVLLYATVR